MNTENITISPLFTGLTRPAMKMGITLDYLCITAMLSLCFFILSDNPLYGFIYIPLHMIGWVICRIDPFIFNLIFRRADCAYCPNKKLWGCAAYEPF